jgi:predicted nucleic acid-binding protein
MGEVSKGWHLLPEGRRKQDLGHWIAVTEQVYAERLLSVDHDVARLWGELTARAQQQGIVIPAADGLIAATAVHHGLRVATRNTRHFTATGALVHDPWESG